MKSLCLFLSIFVAAATYSAAQSERPNILFIAVDDLRPELAPYGAKAITPNIDRLAAEGLKFNRAYCNQAVCGASRTSLMSGLYPEFTKLRDFQVEGWRQKLAGVVTLNQNLKDSGYLTLGLGKIYHGQSGDSVDFKNWDRWFKLSQASYQVPENIKMHNENDARYKASKNKKGPKRGPVTEAGDVDDEAYLDGMRAALAAKVIKHIANSKTDAGPLKGIERQENQPFFLAVGFTKPHLPFVAPKKYWDLYQRDDFKLPPNIGIPPGYPERAANPRPGEIYHYGKIPQDKNPKQWSAELNAELIHGYHACVSYMDANVGKVLDSLEANGLADNTIVILWGDHGWKLGDHSSWCKHTNLEVDTRVPLLIKHPGMKSVKGESDALVELIDLYPTLCDLAGTTAPPQLQGKSLLPILKAPKTAVIRKSAYSSYPARVSNKGTIGHSIRTARHRYTEWWDGDQALAAVATDLQTDPGETTAISDDETMEVLSAELKNRVEHARTKPAGWTGLK